MKTIIICFFCILNVQLVSAQLTMTEKNEWKPIGKLQTLGSLTASMEYTVSQRDTIYLLLMKDFTDRGENAESHYFSIKFYGENQTFETFYKLLKSFFLEENRNDKKYTQTFQLGDRMVHLQHQLLITGKGVRLSTNDGYINLSKGDIDKLFHKK